MRNKFQQRGFTLIELLVVIVILGILSTISVGTFRSYFAKARDSERVSTVQNLAMMIKVDSGGSGNCSVYNYTGLTEGGETCETTKLSELLKDNDYKVAVAKNGLAYYYGVHLGATEGNNEFFVTIGSEEEVAQNGKKIVDTEEYAFIDGTTTGIDTIMANAGGADGCTWSTEDHKPTCGAEWDVYIINTDGTIGITPFTEGVGTPEDSL